MLKSATRSVGMATRVKKSLHSRGSATSCRRRSRDPGQQVDRALVEAEVVDRTDDLAAFDEVDPVAGESGEQKRLRVDLADVPERGQQADPARCRR